MTERSPAPCCSEVVDATEALRLERCPSCSTDLDEMFRLATEERIRTERDSQA